MRGWFVCSARNPRLPLLARSLLRALEPTPKLDFAPVPEITLPSGEWFLSFRLMLPSGRDDVRLPVFRGSATAHTLRRKLFGLNPKDARRPPGALQRAGRLIEGL